ncbi:MAG TPA: glutamate synthase-related protein [Syntrophorhabdaceae bacterium]|nr:glutamate synthase-related protein [Syntrophorhabdaceae bacterium]
MATDHFQFPEIRRAPSRFRNALGKYRITITRACTNCGLCVGLCPYGVYRAGSKRPKPSDEHLCLGPSCSKNDFYCMGRCPEKAIHIRPNPSFEVLGDRRWPAELLAGTWHMAETGAVPHQDLDYKTGSSGGGFDKIRFILPKKNGNGRTDEEEDISTAIELNRSGDSRPKVTIPVPLYLGGMSFGSVSIVTMLSRVRAAAALGTFCCTGEGGYPEELMDYDDHIITQVATGLFGVREETIRRVRIVEFKYAQGAKPGLGGHLLGDKVTPRVAQMREAVAGSALFSPFPFHSVYSVEDHKKHVDWIKEINKKALLSVKVSTPTDVDMVVVGSYYAGAHIVQLDGSYGGTGAAPDIAKKNIAMPIEYALPKVHKFLLAEGIRDKITIIASGGIRSAYDMAKIIAMGADGVCLGTADLVALECIRCHHCESGRGCARGIATTDEELTGLMELEWGTQRIINMYSAWRAQLVSILGRLGMKSVTELVGRFDVIAHLDYIKQEEIEGELD